MAEFAAAASLALVHLAAGFLHTHERGKHRLLLSFAGGASVAFLFVFLLPELASAQRVLAGDGPLIGPDAYVLALGGILAFYAMDRAVLARHGRSERGGTERGGEDRSGPSLFGAHIASFTLYNALIGFLIAHEGEPETRNLLIFVIAVGLHFLANDHAMRQHHSREYDRIGRWLLVPAPLLGWLAGTLLRAGDGLVAAVLAFLTGAIVLNVLKEELADDRENRLLPFIGGAASYVLLSMLV